MKILYFSPIDYQGLKQRPQYIAEGLAREHEVTYVDPTVSMMKFLLKGGEKPGGYTYRVNEHLKVVRLSGVFSAHRSLEAIGSWVAFSERLQLRKYLREADLVWIGFEPWFSFAKDFPGKIIYDQMDDNVVLTSNPLMRRLVCRTRSELLKRADVLFVTALSFYDKALEYGLHPILVPNAVDRVQPLLNFVPTLPKEPGTRTYGYVGMLAHWFDLDAIRVILDASPENRVVLVGPEEIERINDPRVRYIGPVPKEQVGTWIASFDVCLYPFRMTSLLDTINPVKIYEYLAQNKPVIAVRSLETEQFASKLSLYETSEQLRLLASVDLRVPFDSESEQFEFITKNSWEQRIKIILEEI